MTAVQFATTDHIWSNFTFKD